MRGNCCSNEIREALKFYEIEWKPGEQFRCPRCGSIFEAILLRGERKRERKVRKNDLEV